MSVSVSAYTSAGQGAQANLTDLVTLREPREFILPYSEKFSWVKFFVVLQILMCAPYKFPYSRVLSFKKSTKILRYMVFIN